MTGSPESGGLAGASTTPPRWSRVRSTIPPARPITRNHTDVPMTRIEQRELNMTPRWPLRDARRHPTGGAKPQR